jgi:hypothetical protein
MLVEDGYISKKVKLGRYWIVDPILQLGLDVLLFRDVLLGYSRHWQYSSRVYLNSYLRYVRRTVPPIFEWKR